MSEPTLRDRIEESENNNLKKGRDRTGMVKVAIVFLEKFNQRKT